MKILLVNKFHYVKGGSERYYFTLAEIMKARGHEVIFFSMTDEKNNVPCEQEKYFVSNASVGGGLKSKLNMVMHISYSKEAYKNMKRLLGDENPDLVIFNLIHKQITLSVLDAIKEYNPDLPVFWTMHDLIAVCPSYTMLDGKGNICEKCLNGNFKHCVKNKCIKGSRLLSVLSKHEAKVIKKRKWYDKVDLYICPSEFYKNKLLEAKFTSSPIVALRNPLSASTKFGLNDHDGGYVLYFGRLSKEKGVKTLIDAAVKTKTKLIVLGTGPIEEELKRYVKDGGFDNVELKGFKTGDSLTDFIKNSRCVALPSEWYENGPYSAMEAMALGKPLIVSDNGGLPELVESGVNGYVYSTFQQLCESLNKIFGLSQDEYSKMCACSLNKAKTLFNPEAYAEKLENYYTRITKKEI